MSSTKSRRMADPLGGTAVDATTGNALQREIRQGGEPLADDVRGPMEQQLGADLSGVQVHRDAAADQLAGAMAAQAFTVGSNVFFSQGTYRPHEPGGQHLLAHELAHVVQQVRGTSADGLTIGRADDPAEADADRVADRVVSGLAASPVRRSPAAAGSAEPAVQRMTGCGCGEHAAVRRRPRANAVDYGSTSSKRQGVNLGQGPLDFSGMGFDLEDATDNDTDTDIDNDTGPTTGTDVATAPATAPADRVEDFLAEMAKPGKDTLLHNIPSSGMGRFDAQYLPEVGRLVITVRPKFTFAGSSWKKSTKDKFMADFVKQTQAAWSGKYSFACTKAGFESLAAKVKVVVAPTTDPAADCHVEMTVHESGAVTGIGREQNNGGAARNQGNFNAGDAPVRAHDNLGTRCSLALHDLSRINMYLTDKLPKESSFDRFVVTDGTSPIDTTVLEELAELLAHGAELKATPVPLIVTYHPAKGDKKAKQRAEGVVKILKRQRNNPVRLVAAATELKDRRKEHARKLEIGDVEKGGYKAGGQYDAKAKKDIATFEGEVESGAITIYADEKWAMSFKETDPYSIMAHEFGHMLGNPDEYFGYGAGYLALKKEQLDQSLNESDHVVSQNISTKGNMLSDDSATIQENWGKLVKSTGQKLPSMTVKGSGATNSIMNAGAIVTPAHYATLLEALGRITSGVTPAIAQDQWKFS